MMLYLLKFLGLCIRLERILCQITVLYCQICNFQQILTPFGCPTNIEHAKGIFINIFLKYRAQSLQPFFLAEWMLNGGVSVSETTLKLQTCFSNTRQTVNVHLIRVHSSKRKLFVHTNSYY